MTWTLGIRREDKNIWERRVPLIPADLARLLEADDLAAVVQPYPRRVFADEEYRKAGAEVAEDLSGCDLVLAVKEIPADMFVPGGAYVFFSHTIKAQPHNMAMLRRLLELGCTLIDYERITDDQGRRLVFFSRQAGQAGVLDSLHLLGARLAHEGLDTPFADVKMAHGYADLDEAKRALADVGARVAAEGLGEGLRPLVVGFAGYGNVSQGAQEVFDVLAPTTVTPQALLAGELPGAGLVKVVFAESDMVEPKDAGAPFELQEYYDHPERYRGRFERFLPHLHMLVNGIYWEERYPRLVTNVALKRLWEIETEPGSLPKLRVLGDVSCDIDGSIQCTFRSTMPDEPAYVFDPLTGEHSMGFVGRGPVIMAVDNLPAELSHASSVQFSESLRGFVADTVRADRSVAWEDYAVPPPIRRAVIAYNGQLTPDYAYLQKSL